jgi:O-antigen/teichoic acid export membrane protein
MTFDFHKLIGHARARQVGYLYGSLVASIFLGIMNSGVNARFLEPTPFGEYRLLMSLFLISTSIFSFGYFATAANRFAITTSAAEERSLLGGLVILSSKLSALFIVVLFIFSFCADKYFGEGIGYKIRIFCPLIAVYLFQQALQTSLQGTNRIGYLAVLNVGPQLLFLILALSFLCFSKYTVNIAVLFTLISLTFCVIYIIFSLKPNFTRIKETINDLIKNNKNIGFPIYLAAILGNTTANPGRLIVGYFLDLRSVGQFSLALTLTSPLMLIPSAVGTTYFRDFALQSRISPKVLLLTCAICIGSILGFLVIIRPFVIFLYTDKFIGMLPNTYLCAFAALAHGLGGILGRFLWAHEASWSLLIIAIITGSLHIGGYFVLLSYCGFIGAGLTRIIVELVYLFLSFFAYLLLIKKL